MKKQSSLNQITNYFNAGNITDAIGCWLDSYQVIHVDEFLNCSHNQTNLELLESIQEMNESSHLTNLNDDITLLSVKKLQEICNPFKAPIWTEKFISLKEVQRAIDKNMLTSIPYSASIDPPRWSKKKHIGRIAYLVMNPDPSPITVDVGVPSLGYEPEWIIEDGNHRFAAAIYMGIEKIAAYCSGTTDLINSLTFR